LLSKKFDLIDKRFELVDKKFDKIDVKFERIENKLIDFEKNTEHRFGKIETRLSVLENEMKNTNQRLLTIEGHLGPQKIIRFEKSHEEEPKEN
jgi:chaperonin cofactor prefoldin